MKGSNNMLSVNSNPTSVMAFKGKPSAKAYKIVDELNRNAIYSKAVREKSKSELTEMLLSEKLQDKSIWEKIKLFFKKPF